MREKEYVIRIICPYVILSLNHVEKRTDEGVCPYFGAMFGEYPFLF
ncbi:hypothetical protein HMPREF0973_00491 [Prevotella veroralis F0319]|uniref:Uncharacterized protein n=1 Tax=Prevotella veroralis F0319 TaxID=649761 RepID=C9MLL6_9BACT|nr:hypothetical protein HMPREF0973_00491 [Prevotella veroralis F0319]